MKPTTPTISVLMPVYNCGVYLDAAVRSVRDQTWTDLELVAVNDGSTDGSLDVLQRHADEDERVVVIDQPNGGIVAALNAGLARCRGAFIARMDGDDVAYPHRLERQLAWMRAHPEAVAVGCQTRVIDGD
ncbi:MAG: glycosyltransferase family 2 protein, partial [Planctomycetota bacterium]